MSNIVERTGIFCVYFCMFANLLQANAGSLPSDPDNAALLYYQAFLLLPDPNSNLIYPVLYGGEPDEKVREYIEDAHEAIELTEAAAKIPNCTWGIMYSQGLGVNLPQLVQCRYLMNILNVEARILIADGEYHAAIEKCLMIRRLANHIGNDTLLSYMLSVELDTSAQKCIKDILGIMPGDIDILTWLQSQLFLSQASPQSLARALEIDFELALQSIRIDPNNISRIRDELAQNPGIYGSADYILNLTDEDIVNLAGEPYNDFLNSVIRVLDSGMLYEDKYTEIQQLKEDLETEFGDDPAAGHIITCCLNHILPLYIQNVENISRMNAIKTAIELYIILANTGQLPEILPIGVPKDPYSGEDFEYEITEEGFILRCRFKPINESEAKQYEFVVN